jgi:microsomal epoxide hydrolase
MTPNLTPFRLHINDQAIADLKQRLALSRFPDQAPGDPWAFGSSVSFMRELCDYWQHKFDWRAQEDVLNQYEQYKVALHGIDVHFIRAPGVVAQGQPEPMPLLLAHGWPGSVFEFPDLIDRLTNPVKYGQPASDAFTVIAPSLPGYGLSFVAGQARFGVPDIASCFADLMTQTLGYKRFGVQGGDWGSMIASLIGYQQPEQTVGVHLNMMPLRRDKPHPPANEAEARYLNEELPAFQKEESGYQWIQGTRPQTLSFGLNDSPLGLAAWVTEKFRAWTDCDGDPLNALTYDQMLRHISLYWFTGCIGASFWPYYHRMHSSWPVPAGKTIDVPVGYTQFPHEIYRPPRSLAEHQYTDIRRWTEMPKGGHFAAMEQPDLLATEIREFFRPLRQDGTN